MKFGSNRLVMVFFLEIIALCVLGSFYHIGVESTVTLLIFNILFSLLTFGLSGEINRKLGLLALGNILGLGWNFVLNPLVIAGVGYFGETFNVFLSVFRPFLNFMWILSFWSLSLSALPKPRNIRDGGKT